MKLGGNLPPGHDDKISEGDNDLFLFTARSQLHVTLLMSDHYSFHDPDLSRPFP